LSSKASQYEILTHWISDRGDLSFEDGKQFEFVTIDKKLRIYFLKNEIKESQMMFGRDGFFEKIRHIARFTHEIQYFLF